MNDVAHIVYDAFRGHAGPAALRIPERGDWFEREGWEIESKLLALNPDDLEYTELILSHDGSFLPAWSTSDGLRCLLPGIVRVCFEIDPTRGQELISVLFTDILDRVQRNDFTFTPKQRTALIQVHESFYCTESFGWNPDLYKHELIDLLKKTGNE